MNNNAPSPHQRYSLGADPPNVTFAQLLIAASAGGPANGSSPGSALPAVRLQLRGLRGDPVRCPECGRDMRRERPRDPGVVDPG